MRARAAAQARQLVTGEEWEACLRAAARFPGWSFTNVLLITAQRPEATRLGGYQEWQGQGRRVRRGEPGIQILTGPGEPVGFAMPHQDRRPAAGGRPADVVRMTYVWDIAQTTGLQLDGPAVPPNGTNGLRAGLWDALTWLARREGFAVRRSQPAGGDSETSWSSHRITITPLLDGPAAVRALLHELGHVLAHGSRDQLTHAATGSCRGVRKIEADSIAFIVAARLGLDTSSYSWPQTASWVGSDSRAQPEAVIQAVGSRITRAAGVIVAHLDAALAGAPSPDTTAIQNQEAERGRRTGARPERGHAQAAADPAAMPPAVASRVLAEAERFYRRQLTGSWVPGYLADRGVGTAAQEQWRAGYAPAEWTALTGYLRQRGYTDAVIEATGLARRSSRRTLIDHFRDRVMFAVRDVDGNIAGFIGRARPGGGPKVPKYLNSPQTAFYRKGELLFGLHEARGLLAGGAIPVLVEGPFDAIAVSVTGGRYVGLAPCGTALTPRQAAALASFADLRRTGALVALDGDRAGRDGAARAYEVLLAHSDALNAAVLPGGCDPAGILQAHGAVALADALSRTVPLAQVVIDAHLDRWGRQLDHVEGQLAAMRSAAALIARTLPVSAADAILGITGGRDMATLDESLHPVASPVLPEVARLLPAPAACQILRIAGRTKSGVSDAVAEVANAVTFATLPPRSIRDRAALRDASTQVRAARAATPLPQPCERAVAAATTGPLSSSRRRTNQESRSRRRPS